MAELDKETKAIICKRIALHLAQIEYMLRVGNISQKRANELVDRELGKLR